MMHPNDPIFDLDPGFVEDNRAMFTEAWGVREFCAAHTLMFITACTKSLMVVGLHREAIPERTVQAIFDFHMDLEFESLKDTEYGTVFAERFTTALRDDQRDALIAAIFNNTNAERNSMNDFMMSEHTPAPRRIWHFLRR